jgi:hypothetical protein
MCHAGVTSRHVSVMQQCHLSGCMRHAAVSPLGMYVSCCSVTSRYARVTLQCHLSVCHAAVTSRYVCVKLQSPLVTYVSRCSHLSLRMCHAAASPLGTSCCGVTLGMCHVAAPPLGTCLPPVTNLKSSLTLRLKTLMQKSCVFMEEKI